MEKIKVGIIGCGNISLLAHVPALLKNDNAEVAAICDILSVKMDNIEKLFGRPVKRFEKYSDLLQEKLDAVHINTPNYLHSEVAVAALKAGMHVFCEKPDAISVSEALKMQAAQIESGKVLMCMRNNRYTNVSKYFKRFIEEGGAGEIYSGRCGWQRRRGIPGRGGWFTTKAQSGGGPLIDLGVHMIDLALYLMGNPRPVAVSGSVFTKFAGSSDISDSIHTAFGEKKEDGIFDVEDLAMGFIKFENGACLQIEFSWASNIEEENIFVQLRGTKAGLDWNAVKECKIYGESHSNLTTTVVHQDGMIGHPLNIDHFYRVISGNEKPDYTISQGVDMIKILSAIYESAASGKEVRL